MRSRMLVVTLLSLLLSAPVFAQTGYTYTLIAESGVVGGGLGAASLNNAGTVAFGAFGNLSAGIFRVIYAGDGAALEAIAGTATGPFATLSAPSLNDAGAIAFVGTYDAGGQAIVTYTNGAFRVLYSTFTNGFAIISTPASLNNVGQVAFAAGSFNPAQRSVYRGDGRPLTLLPGAQYGIDDRTFPSINDAGFVAYAPVGFIGPFIQATFLSANNGQQGISIAIFADLFSSVSLNNAGQAAFVRISSTFYSVEVGGVGLPISATTLASTRLTRRGGYLAGVSLNNAGQVAFLFGAGTRANILTGVGTALHPVIRTGDRLLGSTVTGLNFAREGLNDNGQVAFAAFLADGREVVVRADPAPGTSPRL